MEREGVVKERFKIKRGIIDFFLSFWEGVKNLDIRVREG